MDKNLDIEKLMEQARFLSQLINSGAFGADEAKSDAAGGADSRSGASGGYAGAFSAADGDIPIPGAADNQDIINKAMQAVKIFQAMNQGGQTSDSGSAYDNTSVHNDSADHIPFTEEQTEEEPEENENRREDARADYSRIYDDTFSTPDIKAIKSAVRFLGPGYQKPVGIWIKFLEMQNMMQIYANRAGAEGGAAGCADWRRGLLLSVRPYVCLEKQCTIDLLLKVMEIMDILSVMEEVRHGR